DRHGPPGGAALRRWRLGGRRAREGGACDRTRGAAPARAPRIPRRVRQPGSESRSGLRRLASPRRRRSRGAGGAPRADGSAVTPPPRQATKPAPLDQVAAPIPLSRPPVDDELKRAVLAAMDSRQYILGPECRQLEAELARATD